MTLRIGTFNVENLFSRARTLNAADWATNKAALEDISELQELLQQETYSPETKAAIKDILERQRVAKSGARPDFGINQIRGKLYSVRDAKTGTVTITAKGRKDWIGGVELRRDVLPEAAIENTARVVAEVDADVLCLVEIEDRPALQTFSRQILDVGGFVKKGHGYAHSMAIDGNDERGIDVGLLSRFPIQTARPHFDDSYRSGGRNYPVFSRDCPEYEILLPDGRSLWMLLNHFKSKGYGNQASNNRKRKRQSERVRAILDERYNLQTDLVVVCGDFNDTPNSATLAPLLSHPNLHDVLGSLPPDADKWTYHTGKVQIDYLLVSQPLRDALQSAGIERRGIYSRNDFDGKYPHFLTVTGSVNEASDHAAVWASFSL